LYALLQKEKVQGLGSSMFPLLTQVMY
jgi:hypothetical protein